VTASADDRQEATAPKSGGTHCTRMAALQRFFDALTDRDQVTAERTAPDLA
jgi:hypothetical protein